MIMYFVHLCIIEQSRILEDPFKRNVEELGEMNKYFDARILKTFHVFFGDDLI